MVVLKLLFHLPPSSCTKTYHFPLHLAHPPKTWIILKVPLPPTSPRPHSPCTYHMSIPKTLSLSGQAKSPSAPHQDSSLSALPPLTAPQQKPLKMFDRQVKGHWSKASVWILINPTGATEVLHVKLKLPHCKTVPTALACLQHPLPLWHRGCWYLSWVNRYDTLSRWFQQPYKMATLWIITS